MSRESLSVSESIRSPKTWTKVLGVIGLIFIGMALQSAIGVIPSWADRLYTYELTITKNDDCAVVWTDGDMVIETHPIDVSIAFGLVNHDMVEDLLDVLRDFRTWYADSDSVIDDYPDMSSFGIEDFLDEVSLIVISDKNDFEKSYEMYKGVQDSNYETFDIVFMSYTFASAYDNDRWGYMYDDEISVSIGIIPIILETLFTMIEQNVIDNGGNPAPDDDISDFASEVIDSIEDYFAAWGTAPKDNTHTIVEFGNYVVDENGREYDSMDSDNDYHTDFNGYLHIFVDGNERIFTTNMTIVE
jgi:hypothetical protein